MSQTITIYDYLAWSKDQTKAAAVEVIENHGYTPTITCEEDLADCLKKFVSDEGEQGLMELARIHPDRQLILDSVRSMGANGTDEMPALPAPRAQAAPAVDQQNNQSLIVFLTLGCVTLLSAVIIAKL